MTDADLNTLDQQVRTGPMTAGRAAGYFQVALNMANSANAIAQHGAPDVSIGGLLSGGLLSGAALPGQTGRDKTISQIQDDLADASTIPADDSYDVAPVLRDVRAAGSMAIAVGDAEADLSAYRGQIATDIQDNAKDLAGAAAGLVGDAAGAVVKLIPWYVEVGAVAVAAAVVILIVVVAK